MTKKRRAVVVGGGLGGLAAGLRLACAGWRVTICERGQRFGGKMNTFERAGFRFDTGPSLITMPWVFESLFAAAGSSLADHVELVPVSPLADYVFADGVRLTYSTQLPEWLPAVRQLEPRDVDGFLSFMRLGARLFALSRETFLRRPPTAPPDLRSLLALRHLPLRRAWGNYHHTIEAHFRSPHLRQMFDRYPTYVGSSPYSSPATLAVIPYIEYAFGGWHVRGGLYRLVEAMASLASEHGVELRAETRVERVEHDGRRVTGVVLDDGSRLAAEIVVMNGDDATTAALLDGGGAQHSDRAARRELGAAAGREFGNSRGRTRFSHRSLSGFVMLLGVARRLPDLAHHTVYFSADYRREFTQLFDEGKFPDDPTVYVCAPSRTDPQLAPEGGETLFVMANAPASDEPWDDEQISRARGRVLARLAAGGFPDLGPDVAVSDVWTPRRIARDYLAPGGAIYGTHSHGWRRAFLRPPNRHARLGGFYRVGGSSHPGGGTPTVLLSAEITCALVREHEG
ncbi:MAG TPA: phytoene desaturase family protein [Pyrinomonadaceae bacterium]|nr:phytoene desaturase family protein [Pyrinomonadaceae bacterium]